MSEVSIRTTKVRVTQEMYRDIAVYDMRSQQRSNVNEHAFRVLARVETRYHYECSQQLQGQRSHHRVAEIARCVDRWYVCGLPRHHRPSRRVHLTGRLREAVDRPEMCLCPRNTRCQHQLHARMHDSTGCPHKSLSVEQNGVGCMNTSESVTVRR